MNNNALLEEWRILKERTTFLAQKMVPGKPLTIPEIKPSDLVRRHEIAQILKDNLDDLTIDAVEKHELLIDAEE